MGLLEGKTQREYYEGSDQGNYQFVSLNDIINQFMVAYVGNEKLINNCTKVDVAFHAQRGLAELSFDTFKSIKSQEIELPPSLKMPLPHDYVNYTKLSFVDDSGIKRILYPTKDTSNPFKILQNEDKSYDFTYKSATLVKNSDYSDASGLSTTDPTAAWRKNSPVGNDKISIVNGKLQFEHHSNSPVPGSGVKTSRAYAVWQEVDVASVDFLDLSAKGISAAADSVRGVGTLRVGISTLGFANYNINVTNPNKATGPSLNNTDRIFDVFTEDGDRALLTFNDGLATESTKEITNVDVSGLNTIYVLITSFIESFNDTTATSSKNKVDDVVISCDAITEKLQTEGDSTTLTRYKSHTPSENNINDYQDYQNDIYWPNEGRRYGLDPQRAQINGSFYIDELRGFIYFSSNISGKTVILDYISDSLGTDEEMKVHKFAEEAMYKHIVYAILSSKINVPEYVVRRYKKERFAAIRQAKLRLSNIKLEELTQVLRGKSKQIKH
jgi:hypothetical protein